MASVTVIDSDRRPVGVVSQDDLLLKETHTVRHSVSMFESRKQRREHEKAAGVMAAQLMTSPAISVTPGTSARDAARLMHTKHIKQLPVIDPVTGRITGTLHQRDVLRVFTRPATELKADVRAVLPDPKAFTIEVHQGIVRVSGRVRRRSQAIALVEAVRAVEGVVDVEYEVACDAEHIMVVPPLL
ncbi:CBS domain-containing protein [Nonomuraea sp. 10N515B]|uniref:CBS domain-containing protein n=1 Tax=Nonomuraea sp. 10N515B TaxID=3457422 RepID=UPI003FCDD39B